MFEDRSILVYLLNSSNYPDDEVKVKVSSRRFIDIYDKNPCLLIYKVNELFELVPLEINDGKADISLILDKYNIKSTPVSKEGWKWFTRDSFGKEKVCVGRCGFYVYSRMWLDCNVYGIDIYLKKSTSFGVSCISYSQAFYKFGEDFYEFVEKIININNYYDDMNKLHKELEGCTRNEWTNSFSINVGNKYCFNKVFSGIKVYINHKIYDLPVDKEYDYLGFIFEFIRARLDNKDIEFLKRYIPEIK